MSSAASPGPPPPAPALPPQDSAGPRPAYHVAVDIGLLLVVILIAVFVWRGPKTLPQLGRMFGEGVRAVRREARRDGNHADDAASGPPENDGR